MKEQSRRISALSEAYNRDFGVVMCNTRKLMLVFVIGRRGLKFSDPNFRGLIVPELEARDDTLHSPRMRKSSEPPDKINAQAK